jgi:protein-arginine kinase activator protein McsA
MQSYSNNPRQALSSALICPTCLKPMSIIAVDARRGQQSMRFICETCRTEETHSNDIDALLAT